MPVIAETPTKQLQKSHMIEWGVFGFGLVSLALAITLTVFAPDNPPQQNAQALVVQDNANL